MFRVHISSSRRGEIADEESRSEKDRRNSAEGKREAER